MRISLLGLIRATVILGGLAAAWYLAPVDRRSGPTEWRWAVAPLWCVPSFVDADRRQTLGAWVWDSQTGESGTLEPSSEDVLDLASAAPWCDAKGDRRLVGRWFRRTGSGESRLSQEIGLARVSFPSRTILDRIPCEVLPVSAPAWLWGERDQVVFAAGDGELYQYEFDRRFGVSLPEDSSDAAPCPLVWRERPRRLTRARFNDPFTSSSIQGGSALLVSARIASGYDSEEVLARDEIWYLALDSTGREILHATLVCAPAANDPLALRHPTWVDRESPWLVHYRPSTVHAGTWDMRAAPAEIDTSTGTPRAFLDRGITLASACRLIAPPLTADGRHVGFIRASDPAARLEFTSLPEQNDDEVARTN